MVWLLVFALLFAAPVTCFAEDGVTDDSSVSLAGEEDSEDNSALDLDALAAAVADGVSEALADDEEDVSAASLTDSGESLTGSAYGSVSLSDSVLGLLARVPYWSDYLIVRGSAYDYYIVWGDLSVEDGVFTGTDCQWFDFYTYGGSGGGSSSASFSVTLGSGSVSIDCSSYLVYSSVSPYPLAEARSDWVAQCLLLFACTGVICLVFSRCWSFSQRMRGYAGAPVSGD